MFDAFEIIPTFAQFPQFEQTLGLGTSDYTLRFTWRPKLKAWFLNLYDEDLQPVFLGKRLSPNSSPSFGRLDAPGLWVFGEDTGRQIDLGRELFIAYVRPTET